MIEVAALEAPAVVSSFDDVTVVSEAIEQRGGHLGVCEDARPFAEGEIGGDDDRGALIEAADQVEQELAAGLGEGQVSEASRMTKSMRVRWSAMRPCRPLRVEYATATVIGVMARRILAGTPWNGRSHRWSPGQRARSFLSYFFITLGFDPDAQRRVLADPPSKSPL